MENEKTRSLPNRLICYFVGLFIMTAGIAISVKSNLGVSPVSSIPYTVTRCWGLEMGKATILFHCVLVLIQVLILRKRFQLKSLLQIPVGIVFGYFTTFCNYLMTFAPTVHNFALRIGMCLVSIVLVAIGIFFYMPANIMPLAGEGVMQAVSEVTKIAFPKVKVAFDDGRYFPDHMPAGASSVRQCRHRNDSGSGFSWCCFRADYADLGNHSEAETCTISNKNCKISYKIHKIQTEFSCEIWRFA